MTIATCIEDLRTLAKKKTPRAIFEYVDCGAYSEYTKNRNTDDLQKINFRQRVAINVDQRTTRTQLLGKDTSLPVILAPTGLTGLNWPNGEVQAARAAESFGVPFVLSTMSICSIEDVAQGTQKPFWFQLYLMRDRSFAQELLQRAQQAHCPTLVLTLDLQVQGQRHRDIKNGLSVPPKITLANLLNIASKPGWILRMMRSKSKSFGNLAGYIKSANSLKTLSEWIAGQFDPTLSWKEVEWIRNIWPGKLILKGIMDIEDARIAAQIGADAIVVSNHGGRQLDGAPSSISVLQAISDEVGTQTELLFDGGIRSGQDVLKALACGAKGTMIGRAFLYGLAANGRRGVEQVLQIIQKEMDVSMALTGVKTVTEVGRHILMPPS